jgi:hypothetical protein
MDYGVLCTKIWRVLALSEYARFWHISVDAEPFYVIHMGLMNDALMWNRLLVAILCHADHLFGLRRLLAKAWQAVSKFQQKLMLLSVTTPYQLILNHFVSSIWVQWVMLCCETGSWLPFCAKPITFLGFRLGQSLASNCFQIPAKTDSVCSHRSISVDAEPLNDTNMDLMSDVVIWNRRALCSMANTVRNDGLWQRKTVFIGHCNYMSNNQYNMWLSSKWNCFEHMLQPCWWLEFDSFFHFQFSVIAISWNKAFFLAVLELQVTDEKTSMLICAICVVWYDSEKWTFFTCDLRLRIVHLCSNDHPQI